jgi:phytoene desaturase
MKTVFHGQGPLAASPVPSIRPSAPGKRAVVIGSGFGGLGAAIRLACRGYDVTVVEKLDGPGGRAYVHRQDGFVFDAGPTIITAPWFLEELWTLCGRKIADDLTLTPMAPFYRLRFSDGTHFDYHGDTDKMYAEIERFAPGDLEGYKRFAKYADLCYRLGFEELGPVAFPKLSNMLAAAPQLIRMQGWRTIFGVVSQHIRDPKLRQVMSFHPLLIGGNPFSVTSVYALVNSLERRFGVHWAMGGTGVIVDGLVKLLESQRGRLRLNAEVRKIDIEPAHGSRRRAPPASRWPAARRSPPTSSSPTPTPPGPTSTWWSRSIGATGPTAASTRASTR